MDQTYTIALQRLKCELGRGGRDQRDAASLRSWVAARRGESSGPSRRGYHEQVVRILHSLASKISAAKFGGSGANEVIAIHPRFIEAGNIFVTERAGDGIECEISAEFYECSCRGFDGEDEKFGGHAFGNYAQKKYDAMDALGRIAYEMCMWGDGPSLSEFFPHESSVERNATTTAEVVSSALGINNGEGDGDEDEESLIMEMLRKSSRTNTSEDKASNSLVSAMLNAGVPFTMCRLVSDLLHDQQGGVFRSDHSFSSFRDVLSDLQQMKDNPDDFLHASSPDRWKIAIGNKLYGRDGSMQTLLDAANRVAPLGDDPLFSALAMLRGKKNEVVMVSGHSGAGKSRLVRDCGSRLRGKGWRFLQCKFDRLVHPEPLSVLASAFNEFFGSLAGCPRHVMQNGRDQEFNPGCLCPGGTQDMRRHLTSTISPDGLGVLAKHIPSLSNLLGVQPPLSSIELNETMMASLFYNLLWVLSGGSRPVLFFIDDLQWADPLSLALLTSLAKGADDLQLSTTNSNALSSIQTYGLEAEKHLQIMFVGTYRDNEVDDGHPLAKVLHKFQSDRSITLTNIPLERFDLDTLSLMLSETLHVPVRRTRPLSAIVIQKTDGQPLHVIEFVQALASDGLLTHSFEKGWEWDADSIEICSISDSVAELYAFKLHRLPGGILRGLQILSCFGSQIDQQVLKFAADYDGENSVDIDEALRVALSEGLVERAAHLIRFSHDAIQKATIDSLGDDGLVSLLHKLAAALIKNSAAAGKLDSVLFVIVDLVNRIGSERSPCLKDRAQFAELNASAASKAIEVPDFAGAAVYAEHGISFLEDDCWNTQYNLSIQLHETSALSLFSCHDGNREKLQKRIDAVFEHAREFADKFKTFLVWMKVLGMIDVQKAADASVEALDWLGEPLDMTDIDLMAVRDKVVKCKEKFSGERKKDFLSGNPMTDPNKLMAMKIMSFLMLYYHKIQSPLTAFVTCRMVEMSTKHGLCEHSVSASSGFSATLVNMLGDIEEGNAWGRMTLSLMQIYSKEALISTTHSGLYGIVFVWKEPIQSTLEPLAKGISVSFGIGNIEWAAANTFFYVERSFISGKDIKLLLRELETLARQHGSHFGKDSSGKPVYPPLLQFCLAPLYNILCALRGVNHLLGRLPSEDDTSQFPWDKVELIENDQIINLSLQPKSSLSSAHGAINTWHAHGNLTWQAAKSVFCRDMDSALKYMNMFSSRFMSASMLMRYNSYYSVFIEALVTFYFKRSTGEECYQERGKAALAKMKEWAAHSEWNWKNKLLLMEAEYYNTVKDYQQAAACYEASIEAARKHKFLQEEALGSELAAVFSLKIGQRKEAISHYERSIKCHKRWGALAVARRIELALEIVLDDEDEP